MVQPLRASSDVDAAPDWSVVPFAVACARCGHDLHGRSEPTCPGCALTFRWADAVPIEQLTCTSCGYHLYGLKEPRCPECATGFTWDEALASYHRQRKPLFEYQWRTKPVRSLFYTWWLAMRPKKLWTAVEIHDPVRWGPLVVASIMTMIAMALLIVAGLIVEGSMQYLVWYSSNGATWRAQGNPYFRWIVRNTLRFVLEPKFYIVLWGYFSLWQFSTWTALLIFRQSMRKYRIRPVHTFRIATYSAVVVWMGITLAAIAGTFIPSLPGRGIESPTLFIASCFLLHSIRSCALSHRDYLRMDHPWSVSAAAHVIAVLLTLTLAIPLMPQDVGLRVAQAIAYSFGVR